MIEIIPKDIETAMMEFDVQLHSDDRLDAGRLAGAPEFAQSGHGIVVGQSRRLDAALLQPPRQFGRRQVAVGVGGMDLEIN